MKRNSLGVYAAQVVYRDGITCYPQPIIFMDEASAIKTYLDAIKDVTECRILAIYKIADFDPIRGQYFNTTKRKKVFDNETKEAPLQAELEEV